MTRVLARRSSRSLFVASLVGGLVATSASPSAAQGQPPDGTNPPPSATTAPPTTPPETPPPDVAPVQVTPPQVVPPPNPSTSTATPASDPSATPLTPTAGSAEPKEDPYKAMEPEPFGFADFSWAPASYGSADKPLKWGPFTGELRIDANYHYSFNDPKDNTISGSSEVHRHNEIQVTQIGFGGDFFYKNVQARLMTQFGLYSTGTPRNDASPGRGQWNLQDAYRYISEAYAGYHINALGGINVQAGIFMSYVGLWSYYNFDNWTYQPSYVSSNTPWFFNGVRAQIYTSDKLKIEPWVVNGWQSYGKFNQAPGIGLQVRWAPTKDFVVLGNQYWGTDTLGNPDRFRIHTDDSAMLKYYENKGGAFSKAAMSVTVDAGCEYGGGVDCGSQYFIGFMTYQRFWFAADHLGLTIGGGAISNPGRYLVLMPPINGATAFSGTPYFTYNPGDRYAAYDFQTTFDIMPTEWLTLRTEFNHRAANVPYFTGPEGVTPPGGNQGAPGSLVPGWSPDLVKSEDRITIAWLLRY